MKNYAAKIFLLNKIAIIRNFFMSAYFLILYLNSISDYIFKYKKKFSINFI